MEIEEFDKAMIERYPAIDWLSPIGIRDGTMDCDSSGLGCRLCIGRLGYSPSDPAGSKGKVFHTVIEFVDHLRDVHKLHVT